MNSGIDWDEVEREVRQQEALEYITVGRKNTSPEVRLQTPQIRLLQQICDLAKELGITKVDLCRQWHIAKRQIYYYLRGEKMPRPAIHERMKVTYYALLRVKRESGKRLGQGGTVFLRPTPEHSHRHNESRPIGVHDSVPPPSHL